MVKRLRMRATLFKRTRTAQRVLHLGASFGAIIKFCMDIYSCISFGSK